MDGTRHFRIPLLLAMLLLPVGCATVGPDYAPPETDVPDGYRGEAILDVDGVDLKWWELFDDPVLYDLVLTSLANNRDVRLAVARIEEARAVLGFTRADQYPAVDIEAGANAGNFAGRTRSEDTRANIYIAPVATWEIDFWGKFRRATESARAELIASEYGLQAVRLGLITDVAATYYRLLDFHLRRDISRMTLESRLEGLDIIEQRFEKGIIPEIDLNQAQIQKEIAAAAIPQFARQIARTEHALSILLGRLPADIPIGDDLNRQTPPPDIPVGLPSAILQRRPDLAQAMAQVHAQTAQIGVATALRYPAVSLTGLLGLASSDLGSVTSDGGSWFVGGTLLGPIIDFDKSAQRVAVEEARLRQAVVRYEDSVLRAFQEVEDALVDIETYRMEIDAVENQLAAARNAKSLSTERYDKGVTSYLEVLEADRQLFDVELTYSDLRRQYFNSYVRLYKALGGGWLTREENDTTAAEPYALTAPE